MVDKTDVEKRLEELREALGDIMGTLSDFASNEQSIVISRAKKRAREALDADDEASTQST